MASVFIDIIAPTVNIIKENNREQDCVQIEIVTDTNERISMHFPNKQDLQAFVGLLNIAIGNTK